MKNQKYKFPPDSISSLQKQYREKCKEKHQNVRLNVKLASSLAAIISRMQILVSKYHSPLRGSGNP